MSGMLKRRPGDDQRQRSQSRTSVREYIGQQPPTALFCAADVARATGVMFGTAVSQIDALARRGQVVQVDKPGDSRRFFKRVVRS